MCFIKNKNLNEKKIVDNRFFVSDKNLLFYM